MFAVYDDKCILLCGRKNIFDGPSPFQTRRLIECRAFLSNCHSPSLTSSSLTFILSLRKILYIDQLSLNGHLFWSMYTYITVLLQFMSNEGDDFDLRP